MFENNDSLRLSTTKMMDASDDRGLPASPPTRFYLSRRIQTIAGLVLLLLISGGYTGFLITNGASYAGGSDASGYFNSTHLFSQGQIHAPILTIPHFTPSDGNYFFQQPLGFTSNSEDQTLLPTYPPGLPLHLLIATQFVSWDHAAILINVLSSLLSGVVIFLLGRKFCHLKPFWAVAATCLIWACPLFVFFALQPMTDVLSTAWCLLAFYSAMHFRNHVAWSVLTGAAVGIAVLVRPTNLIVMIPILFILRLDLKSWFFLILGGIPFAGFQIFYNYIAYGKALTTGYGDISSIMKSDFVGHNALHFTHWIPQLLSPTVLLVFGIPWLWKYYPRLIPAMGVWIVGLITFYAFYFHSGETWWYLRFILPTFPFLILLALMVAQKLSEFIRGSRIRTGISIVLIGIALGYQYHLNRELNVTAVRHSERVYRDTSLWLQEHVPENALMVAMQTSGSLHFYNNYPLIRYDLINPEKFAQIRDSAKQHGQPIYAPLFPFEIDRVVTAKLGGEWEKVTTVAHVSIWKLKI